MKLGFTKVNSSTLVSVITVQPSLNLEFQYSWKNIFMSLYTLHEKKGKKKPFLYDKTCMKLLYLNDEKPHVGCWSYHDIM